MLEGCQTPYDYIVSNSRCNVDFAFPVGEHVACSCRHRPLSSIMKQRPLPGAAVSDLQPALRQLAHDRSPSSHYEVSKRLSYSVSANALADQHFAAALSKFHATSRCVAIFGNVGGRTFAAPA
jgi:hypothetical protein